MHNVQGLFIGSLYMEQMIRFLTKDDVDHKFVSSQIIDKIRGIVF